jgi:hypothetical protein
MRADIAARIDALGGFWIALTAVLPAFHDVARVIRLSTSAGLLRTDTGMPVGGSGGEHVYPLVADATDIPRFLDTLHARCWLAGFGWMVVGVAGQLLERSIVDRSVGAPERLVFEGPPIVVPPLAQDAEARQPKYFEGGMLDTRAACPPLTKDEQKRFDELRAQARKDLADEQIMAREQFIALHSRRLVERGMTPEEARNVIENQARGVLLSELELPFDNPELAGCTVADVLADPARFKGETLADPIEGPAYGRCKAKILLRQDGTPWIRSFAHGGATYTLQAAPPPKHSLAETAAVFRKWLGEGYDIDALKASCAVAAAERLTGDPPWLLVISGPGAAKTETVQALAGAGAHVTSTIASEGALLSATSAKGKQRHKTATGGLLRKIGERGVLVIKDVTTILSADRNIRGTVLAAIREIYDGRWERNVGTDGGQTLTKDRPHRRRRRSHHSMGQCP